MIDILKIINVNLSNNEEMYIFDLKNMNLKSEIKNNKVYVTISKKNSLNESSF